MTKPMDKEGIRLQCTYMHGCHCVELLEELVDTQAVEISEKVNGK